MKKITRKSATIGNVLLPLFFYLFQINSGYGQSSAFEQYSDDGPYSVVSNSFDGPGNDFAIYRPSNLGANGEFHPIITWGNGTGATPSTYNELLEHLASYGFIVIASRSTNTGSGDEMIEGIDWLLSENNRSGSIYFQKINPTKIGATGHSQGGAGTINTAINDKRLTAIAPLAPATFSFPFFYSTEDVDCPLFIMVGASDGLANPSNVFNTSYSTATAPAIYGSLIGAGHFTLTGDAGSFRKYITAWFEAMLWERPEARQLFFSSSAALFQDNSWRTLESMSLDEIGDPGNGGGDPGNGGGDPGNPGEEDENIALIADVSTSFVSLWREIEAVNDGITPSSSSDDSNGAYGNYQGYLEPTNEYVQYTWDQAYNISSTEVYWFDTFGTAMAQPDNAQIEYWDGNQWLVGPSVPIEEDQYNMVSLNITTDQIRVRMERELGGTGIIEWRVIGTPDTTMLTSVDSDPFSQSTFTLNSFPNPFHAYTTVSYSVKDTTPISLSIYDATGQLVATVYSGIANQGNHQIRIPATSLTESGTYFCVLKTKNGIKSQRLIFK